MDFLNHPSPLPQNHLFTSAPQHLLCHPDSVLYDKQTAYETINLPLPHNIYYVTRTVYCMISKRHTTSRCPVHNVFLQAVATAVVKVPRKSVRDYDIGW
jgi:hypothetical protein